MRVPVPYALSLIAIAAIVSPSRAQITGIGPKAPATQVFGNFRFTEGPAQNAAGEVFFTDVATSTIHKIDARGNRSTFLTGTNNANGIFFSRDDRMIVCQMGAGRVIEIDQRTKAITPRASGFGGLRFNSPNDVVVDVHGGFYFTDPTFGGNTQPKQGVYYVDPAGRITLVVPDLTTPNGIILSPREDVLYVAAATPSAIMAYPVTAPGKLGTGRALFPLGGSAVDGMTVDTKGNLYLTRPRRFAIEVVTPAGRSLGTFSLREAPSNCAFGGPNMQTLYITARTSIYKADMLSTGHLPMRMRASANRIPITGGNVDLDSTAAPVHVGRIALILAGSSGTAPGLIAGGTRVPINVDAFTTVGLTLLNTPIFSNFVSLLGAGGNARATLRLPRLDPSFLGNKYQFAATLLPPLDNASNAVEVEIVR